MRKRARGTSPDDREKVLVEDEILEDFISRLSDDILVSIISRLTLREAARTSVLSSRWKYLWCFATVLNFDGLHLYSPVSKRRINLGEQTSKYINWVNRVLESHRALNIDEFGICFPLDNSHGRIITNWIYTAMMSKRVQNLQLHLQPPHYNNYTFPQEFYDSLQNQCGLTSIKYLRSLCFYGVNVTGEILEFFIHNCPLDRLCVSWSSNLSSLTVVGPSIQLKNLEICNCMHIEEVGILAPSLLSFRYCGPNIKLQVENVPQLVEVSISSEFHRVQANHVIVPLMSYFPQLKVLELGFPSTEGTNAFLGP